MKRLFRVTLLIIICLASSTFLTSFRKGIHTLPEVSASACKLTKESAFADPDHLYTQFLYDAQGRVSSKVKYYEGKIVQSTFYKYNQKGQLIQDSTGGVYDYDKRHYSNPSGGAGSAISDVSTRHYNAAGQVSRYVAHSETGYGGLTIFEYVFEYDSHGNRTKVTQLAPMNTPIVRVFEYSNGNCIRETFEPGKQHQKVYNHQYYPHKENKLRAFQEAYRRPDGPTYSKNLLEKTTIQYPSYTSPLVVPDTQEIDYGYDFNDKGFPVRTTVSTLLGSGITNVAAFTNEYACQQ